MKHTIRRDTPLLEAFSDSDAHARSVVDDDGKVAGIVLIRDVIALAAEGEDLGEKTAADVMHTDFVSMIETNNKLAMARKFVEHRIKSLIVCDKEGRYAGELDPPQAIALLPSGLMGFFLPAERVMVRDPYDIATDAHMEKALGHMARCNVSCLLAHEFTGEVSGMLSETDVFRWLLAGRTDQRVTDYMSSPVASMSDQSNLMQVWAQMNAMKVMKMVMTGFDQSVTGLVTATDVLCALSQSMLETFDRYQCPQDADMLMEWHRGGMIMAVSDVVLQQLGCAREDLVGLSWAEGLDDMTHSGLLGLSGQSEARISWRYPTGDGHKELMFWARRDTEQPMMWWSLA